MRPELNDLRVLKLAEMYEMAFERFVFEVAERIVQDEEVRAALRRLVSPEDRHHERLVEHMVRLNAALTPADQAAVEIAALEDVLEVEAAARDFYRRQADQLHDPRVVKLFRELAAEEERHVRLAREALRLAESRAGRMGFTALAREEMRRVVGELSVGLPGDCEADVVSRMARRERAP